MLGPRLLSYRNLAILTSLMHDARTAIEANAWEAFRDAILAKRSSSAQTRERV